MRSPWYTAVAYVPRSDIPLAGAARNVILYCLSFLSHTCSSCPRPRTERPGSGRCVEDLRSSIIQFHSVHLGLDLQGAVGWPKGMNVSQQQDESYQENDAG